MPKLRGWPKGVDNIHQDNEIPDDALRSAVNVDILDSGKLRRRQGHGLFRSAVLGHSLWGDKDIAYFVENNQLKQLNLDGTATVIGSVTTGSSPLAYHKVNGSVYFSSALANGRLTDGVLFPWGVEVPTSPPSLGLYAGTLEPGTYFAVVTYVLEDGRESGTSVQTSITLTDVGGIIVTSMPVPINPAITRKRLYLTTPNGEVFYMAKEVAAIDQFITISTLQLFQECRTQHMTPPPLFNAITRANGRIFGVDALNPRIVWYTEALAFDLVDRRKNYYYFDDDVTMIAGTKSGNGLYVATGNETFFIGNPGIAEQETSVVVFAFGAVARSLAIIPTTQEPIWMTERGAVIGKEGGAAEPLSIGRLEPGGMNDAASMVREENGITQFVVVGNNTEGSSLQASSYAEAEITRRAV
jgi:hypothetical protein